tara:strand:+ start:50 stop:442 length:393 start_codon:yes stop_codon:yes gene_type:complete
MKTLVKPTLVLLFFIALCALPSQVAAQLSVNTATSFSITIEINGNNTTLACNEGCDWKKITVQDNSTLIGVNGIANNKKAADGSAFLFEVQKNTSGITLQQIQGTQWTAPIDISCSSKCTLVVNQFGLAQ